jgi:hypothetical protein
VIYADSEGGRIGRFWWVNAVTTPIEMYNATYNGSYHRVWRLGVTGVGSKMPRLVWRLIK